MNESIRPSRLFYDAAQGVSEEIAESVMDAKNYDPTTVIVSEAEFEIGRPERLLAHKNGEAVLRVVGGYKKTLQDQFGLRTEVRMDDDSVRLWVKTGVQNGTNAGWEKFETPYADFASDKNPAA